MGLIGTASGSTQSKSSNLWTCLQEFCRTKPTWGTCAGMILLAEQCVGASAVIQNGQALIGGVDILVCRNYFGSQISSFEMPTPAPPGLESAESSSPFPGVFIRAPAILQAGPDIDILGKVTATPCKQAGAVLRELERKIAAGENVVQMSVNERVDDVVGDMSSQLNHSKSVSSISSTLVLPGASATSEAREVICAARRDNLLCTAFHPELTEDTRWHDYFMRMVQDYMKK